MHLHLNIGHPVPRIPYKWYGHRFSMIEGWDALRKKCNCMPICLVVILLLDVQHQLIEASFDFDFR